MSVRRARPDDVAALTGFDEIAARDAARVVRLREAIDAGECTVAERAGALVGYAILNYDFYASGFIELVYVRESARRSGVGSELLARVEALCRTPRLFTSTNASNRAMQALLRRRGFEPCGVVHGLDPSDPELVFVRSDPQGHATARRPRVYLAGPEVFLPDAREVGEAKKRLCQRFALNGVFPLDAPLELEGKAPRDQGLHIFGALVEMMDRCDVAVANLTPFRGPSIDPGTAVEIGFLHARGKPVFGYTNVAEDYAERVDDPKRSVEAFGMVDNLMVEGALASTGVEVVRGAAPLHALDRDLASFERCLERVSAWLGTGADAGAGVEGRGTVDDDHDVE